MPKTKAAKTAPVQPGTRRIYVYKWWMTKGILSVEAEVDADGHAYGHDRGTRFVRYGKAWASSRKAAEKVVREKAAAKIQTLTERAKDIERAWLTDK